MRISPRVPFVAVALASVVACTSHSRTIPAFQPAASIAATPQPRGLLPLHVNRDNKTGMNLRLQIAGGSPEPFLLDTGSAGLWAYFNAVGPRKNYKNTHLRMRNAYASGIEYEGTVVYADVGFEQRYTARSVPVVIVDAAGCTKPNCPAAITLQHCPNVFRNPPKDHASIYCLEEGRGLWGTFGVDLAPQAVPSPSPPATAPPSPVALYNVLFGIAPWSSVFVVIAPHELQLGPREAALAGFTFVKMVPKDEAAPLPAGARAWERDVTLCYAIGKFVKRSCVATLFDTGAQNVRFETAAPFAIPTQPAGCSFVVKGQSFSMKRTDGTVVGAFVTGYSTNYNAVRLSTPKPSSTPQVNTGLTFYNRDEVLFDAARGRIGFRALPSPRHLDREICH